MEAERQCSDCQVVKPISEFYKRHDGSGGVYPRCRECKSRRNKEYYAENKARLIQRTYESFKKRLQEDPEGQKKLRRNWRYRSNHGITAQEVDEQAGRQQYKCLICQGAAPDKLVVDHCHVTNAIRGLICDPCNRGLGAFKDNPDALRAAAQYVLDPPGIQNRPFS